VQAAKEAVQAAGGEAPQQKAGETDQAYELRLSRLQRELRITRAELEKNKTDKGELERLRGEMEKAKNRRLTKREYIQLTKDLNAGKVQLDDDGVPIPPELQREIDEIKAWKAEKQQAELSQGQQAQRTKEIGIVREHVAASKADAPLFDGWEGIEDRLLDAWYDEYLSSGNTPEERTKPDLGAVVKAVHTELAKTVARALQSEAARQYLFKAHPELGALLGQKATPGGPKRSEQGSDAGNGPRSLSNALTQDAPVTAKQPKHRATEEEERQEASRLAYEEYKRSKAGQA
jgi:hypothetical protein